MFFDREIEGLEDLRETLKGEREDLRESNDTHANIISENSKTIKELDEGVDLLDDVISKIKESKK